MSHIQSMAILGIRSFSPEEASYIKFFSPLTLIVGPNGSGKTTIIESLRYACTGDLPPNSKGGAFVNDPKVAGTNDVKAQIRLKFYNINGQKMVCSRSLAVSQKKATISQKSIDNALLRYDPLTGEAFSITSRCADMDAELPLHLGVPKAILDNVIFCHQEESNWPLSESSVLKKKFDDIFSSKRYAVALENIKDIRKEAQQEIRIGNVQLDALKSDTAKAKKVRNTLTQLNQQKDAKTATLDLIESKLSRINQETSRLDVTLNDIKLTKNQIQQIINKKDYFESTKRSLESHITPRQESTLELVGLLNEHRIKEDKNQEEKTQITCEKEKLQKKLKEIHDQLSEKHSDMGKLKALNEDLERKIKARTDLIQKLNASNDYDLNTADGIVALKKLKSIMDETSLKNEKLKDDAMTKQNALSDELQLLKSRLLSIQENKKHLSKRIEQDKSQIESIQNKIKSLQVSEIEIDSIKGKINEYNRKLDEFNTSNGTSSQADITVKERELRGLDENISDLNDELARLSKQGDSRAKLSLKRTDKETKETTLNKIYNDCINDVESLLHERPSIVDLEKKLESYKVAKERELASLIEIRNKANRELSSAEARFNMANQNYNKQKKDADELYAQIRAVCGDKSVPEEIKINDKKIENWKERLYNVEGARMIYDKYETSQQNGNCCPLCVRDFKDQNEIDTYKEQVKAMRAFIPERSRALLEQLKQFETTKARLAKVADTWVKWETLNKDLMPIKETVDGYAAEKENAVNKSDVASTNLIEVDNCKIKADKLLLIARNITRINNEVNTLANDIEDIENELKYTGSTRTMSDVQQELEDLVDKSKSVRRDIKRIHEDIDITNRKRQSIENSLRDSREKLLKLEHKRDFKVGLEIQLDELKEQMQDHINDSEKFENDVEPLKLQVQKATEKYDGAVQNWRLVEDKLSSEEREISMFAERLGDLNETISSTFKISNPGLIESLKNEMEHMKNTSKSINEKIEKIDEKLSIIEKDEAERRGIERDLQDQIKYREMQVEITKCEQDLKELEEAQDNYNQEAIERELEKYRNEESELLDKRGSIRGEISQMKDQIRRYEQELSTDYANVDGRYAKLFIDVKTNELANEDLEKYSKVLQTAIMKYHSLKMQDLNKIIKELWVGTYKGGDIDYIEIRADNEGTTANRSFNYRVVMVKNGSELSMRGRCSAGQKVLASIIIRLALAETFCVNCGIFTLDEPTTNLDRENIESLAENLAQIIRSRKEQANFQFVIITHDEEFVEYLSRYQILDRFYRVQKSIDQHSSIILQGESNYPLEENE